MRDFHRMNNYFRITCDRRLDIIRCKTAYKTVQTVFELKPERIWYFDIED